MAVMTTLRWRSRWPTPTAALAHLPEILFESLKHDPVGLTDAAMGMRAECVMLNKGPHVHEAVRMLANIIRKMESHQFKKLSLYRPLALATSAAASKPEPEA